MNTFSRDNSTEIEVRVLSQKRTAIEEVKSKLAVTGVSDLKNRNPAERGISKF